MNRLIEITSRLACIAYLTLATSIGNARGEDIHSGNFMLKVCENESSFSTCMAFIVGALDGAKVQGMMTKTETLYCVADGVTLAQVKSIFLKRLRQYPEDNHFAAAQAIYLALAIAFPCNQK